MFPPFRQLRTRKLTFAPCLIAALLLFLLQASEVFGQTPVTPNNPVHVVAADAQTPARLSDLLTEAQRNNPQIQAAHQAWIAAQQVPAEVSALPDPQVQVQQFSVGSPRPFAGYTNSNFAYIGLGASQDFPYPGKLRLKGQIAKQDSAVAQQQYESVRREVLANVKSAYFRLAYLSQTLAILQSDGELLNEAAQAADAQYRAGMGNQQDLLQAQLEKTKLLREIIMHHLEVAKLEAQMKQLLNRSQSSPDIETIQISQTPLTYTFDELLNAAKSQNPEITAAQSLVQKGKLQVDLAHKDFYPDFNLQYMWQRTDPTQYRAYYMLTFGVNIPIHRSKLHHELAEAQADLNRSRSEAEAQFQQVAFQLRTEYDIAQKDAELLNMYNHGLLPQARAEYQAGIASYQNNRSDFQTLLNSFLDVLHLDEECWQTFADREDALAGIEQLTGLSLRQEGAQQ
ncbi:MAG TPA: TolC family protein [Verrucomicrobiae bacterium]|nr:TolC family protein [Verrucomicrobiae bacterium]